MITAILVDDDYYDLEGLKTELEKISEINVMGMFMDVKMALKKISAIKPHVVFLEIEMSEIDGLELFHKISKESPLTKIVFVTAFDQYAPKAFEVGALDYIVKPVKKKRLQKTLKRIIDI